MSHILDHFWKILFAAFFIVGGWYLWSRSEDTNAWIKASESLSPYLDKANTSYKVKEEDAHANYWKCLGRLKELQDGIKSERLKPREPKSMEENESMNELDWAMHLAFDKVGLNRYEPETKLWRASLTENLNVLEQMHIFREADNLRGMLKGEAPTIPDGQFAKEKVAIVNKIPPYLARDAMNHPANFTLMPATTASLYIPVVDEEVNEEARSLANAKIISSRSQELIKKAYEDGRK